MKKLFAILIAGALLFSAAGCGKKAEEVVTETVKEVEKAAEEAEEKVEEKAEDVKEEAEEKAEDAKEAVEEKADEVKEAVEEAAEEAPQVQVDLPEDIAALGYDSAYVIDEKNMICIPYSSEAYKFSDSVVPELRGEGHSVYAFTYDFASNFEYGRDSTKEKAAEKGAELQELTIGDFSVLASTTKPYFYATEYYIDFNGKFGDIKGAFVKVSESKGEKDITLSPEVQDMIANIFAAE